MASNTTAYGGTENIGGLSEIARVVDTFVAPTQTFTDIRRNASWWLPFLLALLMSVAGAFVIDRQVGYATVVQNALHETPKQEEKLAGLEPDQRAAQIRLMATSYRYTSYASPIIILVVSAIGALGLWASFNFGLGAQTTFGQMFAVWMYASLPRLLSSLIMMVTLAFGGNAEAFNLKNPVGTNIGFYLPDAAPWLRTLLGFVDVIGLWVLLLLVIGTAIVANVKRSHAAAVVVGWWFLILVVTVVVTAATS